MKNLKNNKMLLGIGITFLLLATVSMSYAWFSATVNQKNVKDQIVKTGTLELTYTDGPEIKLENVRPGKTLTKEASVKNTGTLDAEYNLVWQELNNEITNDEMVISITCSTITDKEAPGEACPELETTPISGNVLIEGATIESGYTHNYVITITFKELNKDQNYNQGKNFSGVLGVNEYKETSNTVQPIYCTYDGELDSNTSFVNGIYKYNYNDDGWGVHLNDGNSLEPVTDAPCTYINNIPIVRMSNMFNSAKAKTIDLSNFDTSNVTNMGSMFYGNFSKEIIGLDKIDTSNVTNMSYMFSDIQGVTVLDVSGFDTNKVTNMSNMFARSISLKTIYASSGFVINNVTNSDDMFGGSAFLRGGNGTKYSNSYVDKEYARIDGLNGLPGYFTKK